MNDIDSFLRECVYYPCSALHGVPVKFLGKRFQRFFYADYSVDRAQFPTSEEGFKGYRLSTIDELNPEIVFGMSWKDFEQRYSSTLSRVHFEWLDPFVVLSRCKRTPDFNDDHGPPTFELMFARCEAIATFISAFSRRKIAPKCLVHIRSGIAFGGNFSEYPRQLKRTLLANKGGLPAFMLYDRMGSSCDYGDYLDLVVHSGLRATAAILSFQRTPRSYTAAMGQPDVRTHPRSAGRADHLRNMAQSTWPSTNARHADAPEGSVLRHWHLRNTLHL